MSIKETPSLMTDDKLITDEKEVAETFNTYFVEKIKLLKEVTDNSESKDPMYIHSFNSIIGAYVWRSSETPFICSGCPGVH